MPKSKDSYADIQAGNFLPDNPERKLVQQQLQRMSSAGNYIIFGTILARHAHLQHLLPEFFDSTCSMGSSIMITALTFQAAARTRFNRVKEAFAGTAQAAAVGLGAATLATGLYAATELPLRQDNSPLVSFNGAELAFEDGDPPVADPVDFWYGLGGSVLSGSILVGVWRRPDEDTPELRPIQAEHN